MNNGDFTNGPRFSIQVGDAGEVVSSDMCTDDAGKTSAGYTEVLYEELNATHALIF